MNRFFEKDIPDEMIYGFAGATLVLVASLVLALRFLDQTLRTGTGVILGAGVVMCGYLTYRACKARFGTHKKQKPKDKRKTYYATN